jgi:hypothetical protein
LKVKIEVSNESSPLLPCTSSSANSKARLVRCCHATNLITCSLLLPHWLFTQSLAAAAAAAAAVLLLPPPLLPPPLLLLLLLLLLLYLWVCEVVQRGIFKQCWFYKHDIYCDVGSAPFTRLTCGCVKWCSVALGIRPAASMASRMAWYLHECNCYTWSHSMFDNGVVHCMLGEQYRQNKER